MVRMPAGDLAAVGRDPMQRDEEVGEVIGQAVEIAHAGQRRGLTLEPLVDQPRPAEPTTRGREERQPAMLLLDLRHQASSLGSRTDSSSPSRKVVLSQPSSSTVTPALRARPGRQNSGRLAGSPVRRG